MVLSQFVSNGFRRIRDDVLELSKDERDLLVMGQLMATIHCGEKTSNFKKIPTERTSPSTLYLHHGMNVKP